MEYHSGPLYSLCRTESRHFDYVFISDPILLWDYFLLWVREYSLINASTQILNKLPIPGIFRQYSELSTYNISTDKAWRSWDLLFIQLRLKTSKWIFHEIWRNPIGSSFPEWCWCWSIHAFKVHSFHGVSRSCCWCCSHCREVYSNQIRSWQAASYLSSIVFLPLPTKKMILAPNDFGPEIYWERKLVIELL